MAKEVFYVPDCEHQGDIDYYRNIIIENGGHICKVSWSGEDGDEAVIVYESNNINQIKNALNNS